MQVRRFDLSMAAYSNMGKKSIDGKITYFDSDQPNGFTKIQGTYNEGLLRTPLSSTTDLRNVVIESKEDEADSEMTVTDDEDSVFVHGLGVHYNKEELDQALDEYYNSTVEFKRRRFHQEMSKIERKVNDVLDVVETMDDSLCFERMKPSCFYEVKGPNEIDVFLVLDEISKCDFTVEDVLHVEGCVRVIQIDTPSHAEPNPSPAESTDTRFGPYFVESNSGVPVYLSSKSIGKHFKELVRKSFECLSREWRESSPECKLNSQVHQLEGRALERTKNFQKYFNSKRVSFQEDLTCVVNLIPTLVCRNFWPHNSKWTTDSPSSSWPDHALKQQLMYQGVHLVAMPTNSDPEDIWRIKFLYAQRFLNNHESTPCKLKCLRIIKVLCENELRFSVHFLPIHLETFALRLTERYPNERDWPQEMLAMRFLEFLVMIYQGLQTRKCMDYFIPERNLFSGIPEDLSVHLLRKVFRVLKDPLKYLTRK